MCTLTAWFNNNPDTSLEQAKLVFGAWCADEGIKIIKEPGRKCSWKPSGYGYDRALVYQNAPHFDVIAIRWNPYAKAPRHDHAPRGCIQVVMSGHLKEHRYTSFASNEPLSVAELEAAKPAFIRNDQGVHSIRNPTGQQVVSMHLYAPAGYKTTFTQT